jgi:hypothetical protein
MKLQVPKITLKAANSPRLLKQSKENNLISGAAPITRKTFGTKYSLSLHDHVLNDTTNIHHPIHQHHPSLGQHPEKQHLNKVESNIFLLEDLDNQRPQSVHRKKIIEKLSKSQNKRVTSTLDNFITMRRDESPDTESFNIWNDKQEPNLQFFELYQQRHSQYNPYGSSEQPPEKIEGPQLISNIKKLMGHNISVKYLSRYPWFAQETTLSNPSLLLKSKD